MDTVTHGLTGWLVSRAMPGEWNRKEATAAVTLGAVLPDADHVVSLVGGSEMYVRFHRGLSHSLLGVTVSSLLVALLFARFGTWKDRKRLFLLTLLGQLSHIVLDLLNAYGTQVLQPFSDARFSLDLLFVVDLVFTGIILAGIALSRGGRASRARVALAVLAGYVGTAALIHARAVDVVRDAAVRSGVPVVSAQALPRLPTVEFPDLDRVGFATPAAASQPSVRREEGGTAIPFPAGPFAWDGFIDDGRTYLRARIEPITGELEWRERVVRGSDVPEVRSLRGMSDVETYLWFARFPVASVNAVPGRTEVTFHDMRFDGMAGRRQPFRLRVVESPGEPPSARWGG
jgi:inner membrane protein